MSQTKICSACREEVPFLATRCKFCGARIAIPSTPDIQAQIPEVKPGELAGSAPNEDTETIPISAKSELATVPTGLTEESETSAANSISRPSMAIPVPSKRPRCKTLQLHNSSSSLSAFDVGSLQQETGKRGGSAPPPFCRDRESVPSEQSEDSANGQTASAQMREQVFSDSSVLELILEEIDDEDVILLDDSDLFFEQMVQKAEEASSPDSGKPLRDEKYPSIDREDEPGNAFFDDKRLKLLSKIGLSNGSRSSWNKKRLFQGVSIAAGVAAIGLVINLVGGETGHPSSDSEEVVVRQLVEHIAVKRVNPSPVEESLKSAKGVPSESQLAASTATSDCLFIGDLPEFPWRNHLEKALVNLGKTGICQLFGQHPDTIATAMEGMPRFGPTGYDLLPSARSLEFFPRGRTARPSPTLEFIFVGDAAIEIRLNYSNRVGKRLVSDIFEDYLGDATARGKDHLGRDFVRYQDGEVVTEQAVQRDNYGRTFREIRFMSKTAISHLQSAFERRQKAEAALAQGMLAFNDHRLDEALQGFQSAQKIVPGFGAAYVWEGRIHIGGEQFDSAVDVAGRAIKVSRDQRAQAEAWGIRGVSALYQGSRDSALEHFRSAINLDPARREFLKSVDELETGRYRPARVAKTAARMSCSFDKKRRKGDLPEHAKNWTIKGLLARGNFPDSDTYNRALKKTKRSRKFKREYKRWVSWECR